MINYHYLLNGTNYIMKIAHMMILWFSLSYFFSVLIFFEIPAIHWN
jgi:hypothetical protein